jgi:hypothetical protein
MTRLVVVAVAAFLVLAGCGDDSASRDGALATAGPTTVDAPFRCADPQAEPRAVVDDGSDTLPTGAEAALLCLHDNNTRWAPPRGTLTSGVDRVIRVVNAQAVHDPSSDLPCGGVGAPAWSMVFRYDDGTRTITGDNGGCWDLLVGRTEREGSKAAFEAYLHALVRQRAHEPAPAFHGAAPPCPARPRLDVFGPVADATRARVAALCTGQGHAARRAVLTHAELAILRHDFSTASHREVDEDAMSRCSADPVVVVRGLDAWREPFQVYVACGAYRILRPAAATYTFATLLPRTARMLAALQPA